MSLVEIISREEWGARDPKATTATTATEVYLHHTVGEAMRDKDGDGDKGDDYMAQMQDQHMFTNGWNDIAYNFAIDPDGLEIYEGRGWGIQPGAQKGHNIGTLAIAVMGDYRTTQPTADLLDRIAELVVYGHQLGHIPAAITGGHRDAPGQNTTCPGYNLWKRIPDINHRISQQLGGHMDTEKIPLKDWARPTFEWMIANGYYTEETELDKVRETYEFQQAAVNNHRITADLQTQIDAITERGHIETIDIRVAGRIL